MSGGSCWPQSSWFADIAEDRFPSTHLSIVKASRENLPGDSVLKIAVRLLGAGCLQKTSSVSGQTLKKD